MNWVEERFERDQQIKEAAPALCVSFAAEVEATIEAFNRIYRERPVQLQSTNSSITLTRNGRTRPDHVGLIPMKVLAISLRDKETPPRIICGTDHVGFGIGPEGVMLFYNNRPIRPEDAARAVLESYLFD